MDTHSIYFVYVLFLFTTVSMKCGVFCTEQNLPPVLSDFMDYSENNEVPLAEIDPMLDNQLERLSNILMSVLKHSWGPTGVPIIYLEDEAPAAPSTIVDDGRNPSADDGPTFAGPTLKRSRYYRRYPWKRQNSRSRTRYEVDNRYMCQPTREDVFKLLVALHETRAGNGGKSINFCNRRRSAGAIFTNIRFLGRK